MVETKILIVGLQFLHKGVLFANVNQAPPVGHEAAAAGGPLSRCRSSERLLQAREGLAASVLADRSAAELSFNSSYFLLTLNIKHQFLFYICFNAFKPKITPPNLITC